MLDTSVLIAYFEPKDRTHAVATVLVDEFVGKGRNVALISPVTAMELLVLPLRAAPARVDAVHDFITRFPNLILLPIDVSIASEAASLRAIHNFKAPDALIIATGIVGQVEHLVTNDAEWRRKLGSLKSRVQVDELRDYS